MSSSPPPPFSRGPRRVLVDNPWHRYCLERYTHKDGSDGHYYFIEMAGSCAIIPLFEDGTTVLLRSYRYLLDRTLWEFPIGGMRPGEIPQDVAQKELKEEAGIKAKRWTPLGRVAPYKGVSTEIGHYFLAEDLVLGDQELEPSEDVVVERMPFETARQLLLAQDLWDGQSIVGLMLYDRFRQGRTGR